MDNRVKKLILGYDLCNDYIQISCYNQKTQDMDTICYIGEKMLERIPTVLCRLYDEGASWVCGYEAWKAVNEQRGVLVENFVDALEPKKEITVDGDYYSSAELTRIFIIESLKLVNKYYPHWEVDHLTISVETLGKNTIKALEPLYDMMHLAPESLTVINHVTAYEHYALNQKKELWQHDVGLFDYSRRGMTYYHLTISKKRKPIAAKALTIPLQEYFDGSEIGLMAPPELDRRFLEAVRKVTANKIISTVYLTGEGFEGDWAKISLKTLCHHRKGFIGSNIFSRGACYYSLRDAGLLPEDNFVALNEDVLSKSIYIQGSIHREIVNEELVTAGQVWYDVHAETFFIPDGMDHVTLHLMDYLTRSERSIPISLEDTETDKERPDKTRQMALQLDFEDASHCHIRVTDQGFGEFYPPSGQVTDAVFDIYDETLSDQGVQEPGRLILIKGKKNTIPYHFGLSGIQIYSLEELCYYVYNHIYAVSEETFGDDLIYWIEKNMEAKPLVRRLREAKRNRRSLKEMVRILFMSVDYYSKDEIRLLLKKIEEIEMHNPIETRKVEADNYLRYGRNLEALKTYKKVELMMNDEEDMVTREFQGNVFHNMGIAYARLADGEAALKCFKQAYEWNDSQASRDAWLMMLAILGREDAMRQEMNRMLMRPEDVSVLCKKLKDARDMTESEPVSRMLDHMKGIHSEDEWDAMKPEIIEWLEGQKSDFRN